MTAQDSIRALVAAGYKRTEIGRALGRNDSLIGQIERGQKPGHNLREALASLQARAEALPKAEALAKPETLPAAPRRVQAVRQATRHGGQKWSVASVKEQGTASGAKALQGIIYDAEATGRRLSLNLAVNPRLVVARSGGRKMKGKRGHRAAQELRAGDGGRGIDAAVLAQLVDDKGGDVREAIAEYLTVSGYVQAIGAADIYRVEISSWE